MEEGKEENRQMRKMERGYGYKVEQKDLRGCLWRRDRKSGQAAVSPVGASGHERDPQITFCHPGWPNLRWTAKHSAHWLMVSVD